jgi:hypothetical protein
MENLKIDVRGLSAEQKENVFDAIEKLTENEVNVRDKRFYFTYGEYWTQGGEDERCFTGNRNKQVTYNELMEIAGMSDKKTFTKADLKDGMVTKYNNGDLRLVLGGSLRGKACGWMSLGDFDDNLSHRTFGWTIAEVFSPKSEYYNLSELFDEGRLVSIWKRPPAKTQTEIELEKLQQQIADLQAQANKLQQTL